MSTSRYDVAAAVAAAFLDGKWTPKRLAKRGADAVGIKPGRLTDLAGEVISAYERPPLDRRRELTAFVVQSEAFATFYRRSIRGEKSKQKNKKRVQPLVLAHPLPVAKMVHRPWPVPPFDTVLDLAHWAELPTSELDWFADVRSLERAAAPPLRHYEHSWVYSRRGTVRLLERPRPRTKALQRRVLHEVLDLVPIHDAAHGFVAHRSVTTFAAPHVGRDVVARLDLDGFFASITAGRVFGVLRTIGYPEAVAHLLAGLLTTTTPIDVRRAAPQALRDDDLGSRRRLLDRLSFPHLPQGAPTSPALANLVAYRLDARLAGLATSVDATYTRYADDLVFSFDGNDSARRARRLVDVVRGVIREEGFRVNDAKTAIVSRAQQQRLCGIVVNDAAGVARAERDDLRALLHNCLAHGPESQNRAGHPDFRAHLLGRVTWVAAVNPSQGDRLRQQFDRITW